MAAVLRLTGADLLLVGRHPDKLAIAAAWGISVRTVDELLPAYAADAVVECTGHPDSFDEARRLLRPRGTLVLKSTYQGRMLLDMSRLVVDEIDHFPNLRGPRVQ